MFLAKSIAALSDAVLVSASADMEPSLLASIIRSAANDEAVANAMIPALDRALAPANSGAAVSRKTASIAVSNARSSGAGPALAKVTAAATAKAPRGARKTAANVMSDAGADKEPKATKGKRPRASADFVAQLMDGCEAYVLANPWCATGAIANHLGQKAPKITPLLNRLIEAGKIRKVGEKNTTRYGGPESTDDDSEGQAEAAE